MKCFITWVKTYRYTIDETLEKSDPHKFRQQEDCLVILGMGMAWTGTSHTLTRVTTWLVCSRVLALELNTGVLYALPIGVANGTYSLSLLEIQR